MQGLTVEIAVLNSRNKWLIAILLGVGSLALSLLVWMLLQLFDNNAALATLRPLPDKVDALDAAVGKLERVPDKLDALEDSVSKLQTLPERLEKFDDLPAKLAKIEDLPAQIKASDAELRRAIKELEEVRKSTDNLKSLEAAVKETNEKLQKTTEALTSHEAKLVDLEKKLSVRDVPVGAGPGGKVVSLTFRFAGPGSVTNDERGGRRVVFVFEKALGLLAQFGEKQPIVERTELRGVAIDCLLSAQFQREGLVVMIVTDASDDLLGALKKNGELVVHVRLPNVPPN